jgi:hypothetical protein
MSRGTAIGVAILMLIAGIVIGVIAYNAGFTNGLEDAGRATEVVRVVGRDWGFFPFGLLFFPLFFFGVFFLLRTIFWRRPWGGPGPYHFEEWHRRQHEEAPEVRDSEGRSRA